jgi:membrane protease YdiL (CAAX protease family)
MKSIFKVIWAGLLAVILTLLAGGIWTVLLTVNLRSTPTVPWSVLAMAALLWVSWKYFGGEWGPRKTAGSRRRLMRAKMVFRRVFAWAFLAGISGVITLAGFWIVLSRLVTIPGNPLPSFSAYPWITTIAVLIMASLVSSIAEEIGIRGYFQSLLEARMGAALAIAISALALSPGHGLTQGFVWPTLLFYLFADINFGVMARLTDSILPGIAVHSLGLLMFFTLVWPFDGIRTQISQDGADIWVWIHLAQIAVFAPAAILAFKRLAKITRGSAGEANPEEA